MVWLYPYPYIYVRSTPRGTFLRNAGGTHALRMARLAIACDNKPSGVEFLEILLSFFFSTNVLHLVHCTVSFMYTLVGYNF